MEGTDRQTEKVGHEARERNRQSDKEIFCFGHAIHTCAITNSMGFCSSAWRSYDNTKFKLKASQQQKFSPCPTENTHTPTDTHSGGHRTKQQALVTSI